MMHLLRWENDSDKVTLVAAMDWSKRTSEVTVDDLERRLSDPDFRGILWDNKGLERVLTRSVLEEGLSTYLAAHLNPRAPIASHVGVFLWEQTISREEADQRGQARTSDSPGSENESDQNPLET